MLLKIENLKKEFPDRLLFENINFEVKEKDRVAIIGQNGTGKSTILKIIMNLVDDYEGNVIKNKSKTIGYLSQKVIDSNENTLLEEMLLVFKSLLKLEKQKEKIMAEMKNNTSDKIIEEYSILENKYISKGGYDYLVKIDTILTKFGFNKDLYERKIKSFSGGEKTKIALSKLLLQNPDLIILDEPTNHLDIETIEWLEGYLKNYNGSILLISHDITMINNLCNKIVSIQSKTSNTYYGNYDKYLKERQSIYNKTLSEYKRQQEEIKKVEDFIVRNKAKASKIGMVKDRIKKLEKMKIIEKPDLDERIIKFNFEKTKYNNGKLIELKNLSVGYINPLIKEINLTIFNKDKIAIIGRNGIGKSTLVNAILKNKNIICGKVKKNDNLKIGYFDQNLLNLDEEKTLFEIIKEELIKYDDVEIRKYLGRFGFIKDEVFKKVNSLSGGERVRLILAILMIEKYDVLLLDEPTNHLDYDTRLTLIDALKKYNGCIIVVSHDRYLINNIANIIINIEGEKADIFNGNYTFFKTKKEKKLRDYSTLEKAIFVVENQILRKEKELKKYSNSPKKITIQKELHKLNQELIDLYNKI